MNDSTYALLLRSCISLPCGRRLHAHIVRHGRCCGGGNPYLANLLIQMYGRCGGCREAVCVFDAISTRDVFSWNLLIQACARNGLPEEALRHYCRMLSDGFRPDKFTFIPILSAAPTLAQGKEAHARIISNCELEALSDPTIATALLGMYARHDRLAITENVFHNIPSKDCIAWNAIISSYAQYGNPLDALLAFERMKSEGGIVPDKITLLCVLTASACLGSLESLRSIHKYIIECLPVSDDAINTALLDAYGKCGSLKDACELFSRVRKKDAVAWSAMISAYAENGHGRDAVELYLQENPDSINDSDKVTFLCLLNACVSSASLDLGRAIHKRIALAGFESDVLVSNSLLNMYTKCGSLDDAEPLFEQMSRRNSISWNAMIAGYVQAGKAKESFKMLEKMIKEESEQVKPDKITFLSLLGACSDCFFLADGKAIHGKIIDDRLDSDTALRSALINMYGKCGSFEKACLIFDKMPQRDLISWSAMLSVYAQIGRSDRVLDLFELMNQDGVKPDKVIFLCLLNACSNLGSLLDGRKIHERIITDNLESDITMKNALLNMYGKCGDVKEARLLFDGMRERDVISWNTMLAAYTLNGYGIEALELFQNMELEGVQPDRITFLFLLNTCSNLEYLEKGRDIHKSIIASGFDSDATIRTSLISMYGKCGNIFEAETVFNGLHRRDIVSWNVMLSAYAQNGHYEDAFELFHHMGLKGVKPDKVTFLFLLHACAGLTSLEKGRGIHKCIVDSDIKLDLSIQTALLNMYGKCGSGWEAQSIFEEMLERNVVSWNALLAAYAQNGPGGEAIELFGLMMLEGVKPDKVTFLHLLNACSHAGLRDEGWRFFNSMRADYEIMPTHEHYGCLIDLVGRSGWLDDVGDIIKNMPGCTDVVAWTTVLGSWSNPP